MVKIPSLIHYRWSTLFLGEAQGRKGEKGAGGSEFGKVLKEFLNMNFFSVTFNINKLYFLPINLKAMNVPMEFKIFMVLKCLFKKYFIKVQYFLSPL